jgi:hypothetical protein
MREVLSRLDTQQAELVALRRNTRRGRGVWGRRLPLLIVGVLVALVPMALFAANPFTDLNPGSVHNPNIDAIYNAGITTGCVANQEYCPNRLVNREEMASFLARTAGLGGNAPVANAKTLQGFEASSLVRLTGNSFTGITPNLTTTPTTIVQVTIVAPGPGFIQVNCASAFHGLGGSVTVRAFIRNANETNPNSTNQRSPALYAQVGTGADAAKYQSLTPIYVFSAPAAGSYTFQCQAFIDLGESSPVPQPVQASAATITALYVPFGAAGAGGALATESTP